MAFKVPEKFRITDKVAVRRNKYTDHLVKIITDKTHGDDGFFFLPRKGQTSGAFFLCRTSICEGWRFVAVSCVHDPRCPTWEELHYVKDQFWSKTDIVTMYHPGDEVYVGNNTGWLHLWQRLDGKMPVPPLFSILPMRDAPFFVRLYRTIIRKLKSNEANKQLGVKVDARKIRQDVR